VEQVSARDGKQVSARDGERLPARDVEEVLDEIGFGPFQRGLLLVCGVTWAADAAELLAIGFALPGVRADFGLSGGQAGLVAAAAFVGMLAGAIFWGAVADRIGRRRGFQLTVAIFAVFGLASAFAPDATWLGVLRALAGFGLGGALPLDFALAAEFLPRRNRGRHLVLLESFWAVGTVTIAALALILVPAFGWRPLLATSAVAALLVLWIRQRVPESPRYLLAAGREDEARAVLAHVARVNGRSVEIGALRSAAPEGAGGAASLGGRGRPAVGRGGPFALWTGGRARTTLMLWLVWFAIGLAYYGLFVYLPTIFVARGFSFVQTYAYALVLALAQLPGYLSAAVLVERWGRRRTLVTYLAASAAVTFLFAQATTVGVVVGTACLMSFFSLGAWAALYAYTPESYTTGLRATGMGWASAMARVAAVLVTLLGASVIAGSLTLALVIAASAFAVAALVVAVLGTETRGRPLPDAGPPVAPSSRGLAGNAVT